MPWMSTNGVKSSATETPLSVERSSGGEERCSACRRLAAVMLSPSSLTNVVKLSATPKTRAVTTGVPEPSSGRSSRDDAHAPPDPPRGSGGRSARVRQCSLSGDRSSAGTLGSPRPGAVRGRHRPPGVLAAAIPCRSTSAARLLAPEGFLEADSRVFLWQDGKLMLLPGTVGDAGAVAINERGQIVGSAGSRYDPTRHGFLWQNGTLRKIRKLSTATRMRPSRSTTAARSSAPRQARMTSLRGTPSLGRTAGCRGLNPLSGDSESEASGINNKGWVIGGSSSDHHAGEGSRVAQRSDHRPRRGLLLFRGHQRTRPGCWDNRGSRTACSCGRTSRVES